MDHNKFTLNILNNNRIFELFEGLRNLQNRCLHGLRSNVEKKKILWRQQKSTFNAFHVFNFTVVKLKDYPRNSIKALLP